MKIVLLVDDSPVIRKVAGRILSDLGFTVVEAEDGFDALEKVRYNMPDILIVDWDMPSITGIEFLEEFARVEGSNQTKILYCISEVMVPEMTKAKRSGCHGFLMKPFNREILQHKLQEIGVEPTQPQAA